MHTWPKFCSLWSTSDLVPPKLCFNDVHWVSPLLVITLLFCVWTEKYKTPQDVVTKHLKTLRPALWSLAHFGQVGNVAGCFGIVEGLGSLAAQFSLAPGILIFTDSPAPLNQTPSGWGRWGKGLQHLLWKSDFSDRRLTTAIPTIVPLVNTVTFLRRKLLFITLCTGVNQATLCYLPNLSTLFTAGPFHCLA